ncbi:porphobilinogen synthase, partial [Acinetobacter baumannii]
RILRQSPAIRAMVAETHLSAEQLIAPLCIVEGEGIEEQIPSLPGYYRRSRDLTLKEAELLFSIGIRSVLLFVKSKDEYKD